MGASILILSAKKKRRVLCWEEKKVAGARNREDGLHVQEVLETEGTGVPPPVHAHQRHAYYTAERNKRRVLDRHAMMTCLAIEKERTFTSLGCSLQ